MAPCVARKARWGGTGAGAARPYISLEHVQVGNSCKAADHTPKSNKDFKLLPSGICPDRTSRRPIISLLQLAVAMTPFHNGRPFAIAPPQLCCALPSWRSAAVATSVRNWHLAPQEGHTRIGIFTRSESFTEGCAVLAALDRNLSCPC